MTKRTGYEMDSPKLNTGQKIVIFGQSISALGCLITILVPVCVIGMCVVIGLFSQTPADYKTAAYVACQLHVEENLKAPSTADFPASIYSDIRELESNIWEVRSYVDSQNSFGAMIRTDYYCKVQYIGTSEDDAILPTSWLLLDLQFTE